MMGAYFLFFVKRRLLRLPRITTRDLAQIGRHVLVSLDGHAVNEENFCGDSFLDATEMTIFLEGDLGISVVFKGAILLLVVEVTPGGAINKVLVEGF